MISPGDAPTLSPAWTFSTLDDPGDGDITGTPIVADGCVYVATNRGWVFALNADTGELVWKAQVPYGGGVNSSVGSRGRARVRGGVAHLAGHGLPGRRPVRRPVRGRVRPGDGRARVGDRADRRAARLRRIRQPGVLRRDAADRRVRRLGRARRRGRPLRVPGLDDVPRRRERAACCARPGRSTRPASPPTTSRAPASGRLPRSTATAKVAYAGTANPFRPQAEHAHANAVLKFDIDRASATFGEILDSYKGNIDEYIPAFSHAALLRHPRQPAAVLPAGDRRLR